MRPVEENGMGEDELGEVPDAWRRGAEEVREHLVMLRGGAPFLSSADTLQLVRWFDEGVPVAAILRALDRAWEARRRKPSRLPLGLRQARRHLGAVARRPPSPAPDAASAPLAPLATLARQLAAGDPASARLLALAEALDALDADDPDALARGALAAIRAFRERVWEDTPESGREAARASARDELGDLLDGLDEATSRSLVEEGARARVLAPYARLDATAVWDLVEAL